MKSFIKWGTRKQLVVFFGNAGIGTRGGWGAKAVLPACREVVERANSGKPTDRVPGRLVTVDEFRTSRVSSAMNSPQPCEAGLDRSKPTRPEGWKHRHRGPSKPEKAGLASRSSSIARLAAWQLGPQFDTCRQPKCTDDKGSGRRPWQEKQAAGLEVQKDMAEVSMQRHGRAKQLVVLLGIASIGTGGGWGADAVLRACCKVVCRRRGTDQLRGRMVLVDEHHTSRVSSAVNGQQRDRQLNKRRATRPADWKPPAGQVEQRLLRPACAGHDVVPGSGTTPAPTGPMQQPGSHTACSLEAWA
ncbi:hypothetical protein QJQ45_012068 [Haematococcus lacustris]|nr:hypothetical protein QJQ45_012068 [Haematococcus lacustris]